MSDRMLLPEVKELAQRLKDGVQVGLSVEDTQRLVAAYMRARSDFTDALRSVRELQAKVDDIERIRKEPVEIQLLDFTAISTGSDKHLTRVLARDDDHSWKEWLRFGAAKLQNQRDRFVLSCHLAGATDGEHDSAYVFTLPLVDVKLADVYGGEVTVEAVVAPSNDDYRDFRIPNPGYNPLPGAAECRDCAKDGHPHVFASYLPEPNARMLELFKLMRGRPLRISFETPEDK